MIEAGEAGWIGDRLAVVLLALILTAGAATLAMAGPIPFRRAVPRALGAGGGRGAAGVAGGPCAISDGIFASGLSVLAALAVATLPVPFLSGAGTGGLARLPGAFF